MVKSIVVIIQTIAPKKVPITEFDVTFGNVESGGCFNYGTKDMWENAEDELERLAIFFPILCRILAKLD